MTSAKIIFDANIGLPLVNEIRTILEWSEEDECAEVLHAFEFQESLNLGSEGVWDEQWLPEAAKQGYAIITGDRGTGGTNKGQKLTALCRELGIVHFTFSKGVHHRRKFKKLLTILSVWHEVVHLCLNADNGSRYSIEPANNSTFSVGRGKVVHRPPPDGDPPPKGMLFER